MSMDNARVLMIETPLYTHYVKNVIRSETFGVEIIGTAANAQEALELIKIHYPDVLIIDIRDNLVASLETLMKIRSIYPDVLVVGRTNKIDNHFILQAAAAGVMGFVNEHTPIKELIDAIDSVRRGYPFLPQNLANQFVQELQYQSVEIH